MKKRLLIALAAIAVLLLVGLGGIGWYLVDFALVRTDTPPDTGELPMPMHGPQAHSSRRTPLSRSEAREPSSVSMEST